MPTCFVIMPFGKPGEPERVEFDNVYKYLIEASIADLGKEFVCNRCDKFEEAGLIHNRMIEQIQRSDIAVVDITKLNPNVFYELGVRHALAGLITVIIKRKGTVIPFNIYGLNTIDYEMSDPQMVESARLTIAAFIRNGLESLNIDSLVHQCLPTLTTRHLERGLTHDRLQYQRAGADWKIGIITGDLSNVKTVDIWVNSENTNMQMARFYDRSISGTIRYLGANKDHAGQVCDDTIGKALTDKLAGRFSVDAGTVIVTESGALQGTHNVKRIFHAAAVFGQIGQGFRQIGNVRPCVVHAMDQANAEDGLRNILFPLLGGGQGHGEISRTADDLIGQAAEYLHAHPASKIKEVYFLCWNEKELRACQLAIRRLGLERAPT
jgi:hypothetical protein